MMAQNDPFARLPQAPRFELTSSEVVNGQQLPEAQRSGAMGVPGGRDVSPQLAWCGFPEQTKSFVLTCYDPDAPTQSGWWHWAVANLPLDCVELPSNAGSASDPRLPDKAITLHNDASMAGYLGAAPPPGHGDHRYFFVVHALDVDSLEVTSADTPAKLNFLMFGHVLARGWLVGTFGH